MKNTALAILEKIVGLTKPRKKFMQEIFNTLFALRGRVNFLNLARWGLYHEQTYRRHFQKPFPWTDFNFLLLEKFIKPDRAIIAIDCTFTPKSRKKTYGIGRFWSSLMNQTALGLEISVISIVDTVRNIAFSINARQTPPLPEEDSRIDFYLEQIRQIKDKLLPWSKVIVADGFYAKKKFVDGCIEMGFSIISKLRCDANLRFLYEGDHPKRRGRKKKYDGKVSFDDLSRFQKVTDLEEGISLYTSVVYSISLKREIRLVLLYDTNTKTKKKYAILFSTDVSQSALMIYQHYKSRFQIEFHFRDAKQYAGFEHCQSVKKESLDFHFNASLTTINLAKYEMIKIKTEDPQSNISLFDLKREYENKLILDKFIEWLELDRYTIYQHPNISLLIHLGKKTA